MATNNNAGSCEGNVRYAECMRNHGLPSRLILLDGCGEFSPKGPEGTPEAMICAACDCYRNFHRRVDANPLCPSCRATSAAVAPSAILPPPPLPLLLLSTPRSSPPSTKTGMQVVNGGEGACREETMGKKKKKKKNPKMITSPPSPPRPTSSPTEARTSKKKKKMKLISSCAPQASATSPPLPVEAVPQSGINCGEGQRETRKNKKRAPEARDKSTGVLKPRPPSTEKAVNGGEGEKETTKKKRLMIKFTPLAQSSPEPTSPPSVARMQQAIDGSEKVKQITPKTKFTEEQKEKMRAFAEILGWRILKTDAKCIEEFSDKVGITPTAYKNWINNHRRGLKIGESSSTGKEEEIEELILIN